MDATEQQEQLLAHFEIARELLIEMRQIVESRRSIYQLFDDHLEVLHCDDQLRRIDNVLNWKVGV
ncbi:MAG: hypothetical protein PHV54_03010 [Tolumonas sp.]|nr:hypothetical protein [Tolumonas sp.]